MEDGTSASWRDRPRSYLSQGNESPDGFFFSFSSSFQANVGVKI